MVTIIIISLQMRKERPRRVTHLEVSRTNPGNGTHVVFFNLLISITGHEHSWSFLDQVFCKLDGLCTTKQEKYMTSVTQNT